MFQKRPPALLIPTESTRAPFLISYGNHLGALSFHSGQAITKHI